MFLVGWGGRQADSVGAIFRYGIEREREFHRGCRWIRQRMLNSDCVSKVKLGCCCCLPSQSPATVDAARRHG